MEITQYIRLMANEKTYTGSVCVCFHVCMLRTFIFKNQYYCAALILVPFLLMQIKRNSIWLRLPTLKDKRKKSSQKHSHGSQKICIKYNGPENFLHRFYQYHFINSSEINPHSRKARIRIRLDTFLNTTPCNLKSDPELRKKQCQLSRCCARNRV